jgi:putative transposase
MTTEDMPIPGALNNVIRIDDERIKGHLDRIVRGTVEETLNSLLDAEADRLCNAQRYERSQARRDTRAGHYARSLETKAGEVTLKVPKLRRQTFETAIIERYRRREASAEEALIEMYLAGVSVRAAWRISRKRFGARGSRRRRCRTSTRRSTPPSRSGGTGRSRANTPASTWMGS